LTPIIIRANVIKNKKFPRLTRSTALVWNHSFGGAWAKVFIPAKRDQIQTIFRQNHKLPTEVTPSYERSVEDNAIYSRHDAE